ELVAGGTGAQEVDVAGAKAHLVARVQQVVVADLDVDPVGVARSDGRAVHGHHTGVGLGDHAGVTVERPVPDDQLLGTVGRSIVVRFAATKAGEGRGEAADVELERPLDDATCGIALEADRQ
ncbi:hypothetical protein RZS08_00045, partial [Arthrospira platensis SPKY1]|nr:hypothetical protein [Arthrospira platensis SPKY1]